MEQNNLPWIYIVTHGDFGRALVESAEMICGKLQHVCTIGLMPGDSPENLVERVSDSLEKIAGEAVILVDLFGGTPSNVCSLFAKKGYQVMAGVNMPMLMAVDMARGTDDWSNVLKEAEQMGKEGIVNITARVN